MAIEAAALVQLEKSPDTVSALTPFLPPRLAVTPTLDENSSSRGFRGELFFFTGHGVASKAPPSVAV
jgi:hypothetical protein